MGKTYQQQLALCKANDLNYNTIWRSKTWTLTDYEEMFEDINRGYIIQENGFDGNYFVLNPDWEPEEYSDDEEEEEEEEEKELKTLGYRQQTRLGECAGCKSICEECEPLIITKEGVFEEEVVKTPPKKKTKLIIKKKKFIEWTNDRFNDRDDCYFCKTKNDNDWNDDFEDAVCVDCSEIWKYNENDDGYYKKK